METLIHPINSVYHHTNLSWMLMFGTGRRFNQQKFDILYFNSTIFLEKGRVDYYKEIDKENTLLKEQSRQLTNTLGNKLLKKIKNLLHK